MVKTTSKRAELHRRLANLLVNIMGETEKAERYKFYRLCNHDFESSMNIAKMLLGSYTFNNIIRAALLRDIIISYVRPFADCKGQRKPSWQLKVSEMVPKPDRHFHKTLVDLRNQLFAHTDLAAKDPHIAAVGRAIWMSFKSYDYTSLNVQKIYQLVDAVNHRLLDKIKELENEHFATQGGVKKYKKRQQLPKKRKVSGYSGG